LTAPADGEPAKAFLVSEILTAPSFAELTTVGVALGLACARLTAAGSPVRLLATSYLHAQHRWLGLVLADDKESVHQAASIAQLVTFRVMEV
jgi:hypothetical protein